jgi:hypothetical protein
MFTIHSYVLYGSQGEQYLLPYTLITDWFYNQSEVFTAWDVLGL